MLERIDLDQSLEKSVYRQLMPEYEARLFHLQKASRIVDLPVMIVFEGWDGAGKGDVIRKLAEPLDPRGFTLHPIQAAQAYERKRPWMWRFWLKIPAYGEWAIFDRSWYGRVLSERMMGTARESEWRIAYRDIVDFERSLVEDGYLIVKFFLHISRREQKRRFDRIVNKPNANWRVTPEDWEQHHHYHDWLVACEEALERTDTNWSPWKIIGATDRRFTRVEVFRFLIEALESRLQLEEMEPEIEAEEAPAIPVEVDEAAGTGAEVDRMPPVSATDPGAEAGMGGREEQASLVAPEGELSPVADAPDPAEDEGSEK